MYSSSSPFISKKICLSIKKKKKKKHLTKPTKNSDKFFFFCFNRSASFQKKNQSQELWQKSLKGCVCMSHVKHSENKVTGKWHLKHGNRYFHAQLLHITDITRCRSPPHPTRFCQKKKNPASVWPGNCKANNQVGGKLVTMKRQCQTNSKHNNRHMQVTQRHHVQ